jgi:ABC-2 type transport system ATP-binding protein
VPSIESPPVAETVIVARGLRKSYAELEAVRGIDLEVVCGEVFAFLGPNGAGKTTTVEILEGFRARDGGEVSVLGYDPARGRRDLKRRIGIVLQSTGVEPYLRVEELVELWRGYFPTPRPLEEILEVVGLAEQRSQRVRRLSGGQQRRLDVALGLAGDPDLLFLDEPTTGFDPAARRGAWEMIRNLRSLGKTVLLTTHYLDEAQMLADRVAIITHGRIIAEGPPEILTGGDRATTIAFRRPEGDLPPATEGAEADGGMVVVRTMEPTRALQELTAWAVERGIELEGLTVTRPSLEEIYLELTGGEE